MPSSALVCSLAKKRQGQPQHCSVMDSAPRTMDSDQMLPLAAERVLCSLSMVLTG